MYPVEIANVNKQYHSYTVISANYYLVHTCTCSDTIHNTGKYIYTLQDYVISLLALYVLIPRPTLNPNHSCSIGLLL